MATELKSGPRRGQLAMETKILCDAAMNLEKGEVLLRDDVRKITGRHWADCDSYMQTVMRRMLDERIHVRWRPRKAGGLIRLTDAQIAEEASRGVKTMHRKARREAQRAACCDVKFLSPEDRRSLEQHAVTYQITAMFASKKSQKKIAQSSQSELQPGNVLEMFAKK